ncbi:MAG: hypothetical protein HOP36_10280 [Methyloglobulus sp.]|nr:hypothetical protein [Methyloglobulus sp.]
MQMPGLIDLIGRDDFVSGNHCQQQKFAILIDYSAGIRCRPTVFPLQALGKGDFDIHFVEIKRLYALIEI